MMMHPTTRTGVKIDAGGSGDARSMMGSDEIDANPNRFGVGVN